MKKHVVKMIGDEKGKVMILALVLLVAGGLIMGPLLGLMSTGLTAGQTYERKTAGLYAADAGLEDAINWLINGKPVDWPWTWDGQAEAGNRTTPILINGHEVYVTVETLESENTYMVSSTAKGPEGTTAVMSTLWAIHIIKGCAEYSGPKTTLYGNVYVTEDVAVLVGAKIEGDLVVGGSLTLKQQSALDGDVSVSGNVTMENSSTITGTMCTDGDLTMGNSARILDGDVMVGGTLTLGNDAKILGANNTVFVGEDLRLENGAEIVVGTLVVMGNIVMNGNSEIDAKVYIYGNITIHDKGEIIQDVYGYDNITVTLDHPNATIYGTVYYTGSYACQGHQNRTCPTFVQSTWEYEYEPPDCPGIPATPTKIFTYEVK